MMMQYKSIYLSLSIFFHLNLSLSIYLYMSTSIYLSIYLSTVPAIKPGRFSLLCQNTPSMETETKMDDSIFPVKIDYSTSSYHNFTVTGPIDIVFTKKCNYFSWATRWNHPFLSQSQ